ncbi:hypothetical protein [Nonomuraea sp. NPDC048916]|uniref:hypothetical protein n=1 Tax=Nonomuraea sp. NPDC048916 TaxID=3154232 RepID=UPI0033C394C4
MPGWGPRPSSGFRDFVRQKPAQIIGAGLIGLIVGGILGGGAVAVISGITARQDRHVHWQHPGWDRRGGPGFQECRPVPGGMNCRYGDPYPYPVPTMTMMPPAIPATPVPTRTG